MNCLTLPLGSYGEVYRADWNGTVSHSSLLPFLHHELYHFFQDIRKELLDDKSNHGHVVKVIIIINIVCRK
jgi:hypothetical protein